MSRETGRSESTSRPSRPDLDPRDLSLRGIGGFGIALIVILVAAASLMWWASSILRGREEAKDPPPPVLAEASRPHTPPGPQLQAEPTAELDELRAREDLILTSYAWTDKETGIAQVPIERAIDLLLENE